MDALTQEVRTPFFAVIVCRTNIGKPIDEAWRRIGGFVDAGRFLNIPCTLISGEGELGSVRQVGDSILEAMAGRTDHSYTYAQIAGPMAQFAYHGCVSLSSSSFDRCVLTYTILYDQSLMEQAQRDGEKERISQRFQKAVEAMKREAEIS